MDLSTPAAHATLDIPGFHTAMAVQDKPDIVIETALAMLKTVAVRTKAVEGMLTCIWLLYWPLFPAKSE
jgi:hypothetical protein